MESWMVYPSSRSRRKSSRRFQMLLTTSRAQKEFAACTPSFIGKLFFFMISRLFYVNFFFRFCVLIRTTLFYDFASNFAANLLCFFFRIRVKCGKSRKQLDIDELREFVEVHSLVPEDDKTPYIVASTIEELEEGEEGQRHFINILISSKSLITSILKDPKDKVLFIDTTHGLSCDKLLVLLIGTVELRSVLSPCLLLPMRTPDQLVKS